MDLLGHEDWESLKTMTTNMYTMDSLVHDNRDLGIR